MENGLPGWKKYLSYLFLAAAAMLFYQWLASPLVITVTGIGEVYALAETATLTFTLSSSGEIPEFSTEKVKIAANKIKENLKTQGVLESDIYEASTVILPAESIAAGAKGYQATLNMGIKTTQVNNLDGIMANLYTQGAAVVTQPILSVGDKDKLEKEAYVLAIKDAKEQATGLAWSYRKFFKKIVLVQETATSPSSTVTNKADLGGGMIKISKVLTVSYKMW